jgi:hypothetical protein
VEPIGQHIQRLEIEYKACAKQEIDLCKYLEGLDD